MSAKGLSAHLLTKENLELVRKVAWQRGRPQIVAAARRYYEAHPEEVELVAANLERVGLANAGAALDAVLDGIAAHYFEKLFALVKTYESYWIARNRVDAGGALAVFEEARDTRRGVFIAQSHFGATYLLASVLMSYGVEASMVGKFPEPVGSMLRANGAAIAERYGAARANLLNLVDPAVDVPMEMLVRLKQRQVLSNVFDENNEFSRPVRLLGRDLFGGSGMDLILRHFTDEQLIVVTPFLVRTSDEAFRYELDRHSLASGDVVQAFYDSLERRVLAHPEQWYFVQELHGSFEDKRKGA
jgi:lauroyl/myristoyl acyltransferase